MLPNIVLIVLDATRVDRLGKTVFGRSLTSNIDRFAAKATVFRQAVSAAPWTLPSVASLFTGLFPSEHGVDIDNPILDIEVPTVAELLRNKGYRTLAYTANSWINNGGQFDRGFQVFRKVWELLDDPQALYARLRHRKVDELAGNMASREIIRHISHGNLLRNVINALYGKYGWYRRHDEGGTKINRIIRRDLRSINDCPCFIYVHYLEPHLPYRYHCDDWLLSTRDQKILKKINQNPWDFLVRQARLSNEDLHVLNQAYECEIAYVDRLVGQLLELLEQNMDFDNTMVVVTADHGENIGEHGMLDHQYCLYQTLVHVPLIIRYPGSDVLPRELDFPVQAHDIVPTICELANIEFANGVSLLNPTSLDYEQPVYSEYLSPMPRIETLRRRYPNYDPSNLDRGLKSVIHKREKLIIDDKGNKELYSLETDPHEAKNLSKKKPQLASELTSVIMSRLPWKQCTIDGPKKKLDAQIYDQLRTLGYID